MGTEIERKFLLADDSWRNQVKHTLNIKQGYLSNSKQGSVRIRITDGSASLNIKSMTLGVQRYEFEYQIPLEDAEFMLENLCMQPLLKKTRYIITHAGHNWEVDEFSGDNKGLIIAEIELAASDAGFDKPEWLGDEVSDNPRYYNVSLINDPYLNWTE